MRGWSQGEIGVDFAIVWKCQVNVETVTDRLEFMNLARTVIGDAKESSSVRAGGETE